MANIHWRNPASGDFNTGTNWTGGMVPTASDNAFLDAKGAPYTVTENSTALEQVHSLEVAANVTFVVGVSRYQRSNFQALYGGGNAGMIDLLAGDLLLGSAFANSGGISVGSPGGGASLDLASATLTGGGQVTLNNGRYGGGSIALYGSSVNVDNTISGGGFIGGGSVGAALTNGAAGVIDATDAGALFIQDRSITNNGLIEATGTVANTFLDIRRGANVDQSGGGLILAADGATVDLEAVRITGGTLTTLGAGVIDMGSGDTVLDGSGVSLANKGTLNLTPGYTTGSYEATLIGAIVNSGAINVAGARSAGNQTNLIIDAAGVTLTGAGSITLAAGAGTSDIVAGAAGATLTNVDNTIRGEGAIGGGGLNLTNGAKGVIDADAATALTLDTGSTTTVNAGLIEATGAGGMTIASALTNTGTLLADGGTLSINGPLTNLSGTTLTGGTYQADAGSTLDFNSGAKIVTDDATLILSGAGSVIQGSATIQATLTTIGKAGTLEILNGRAWTSTLALSNAGTLQLGGATFTAPSLSNSGTVTGFGTIASALTNTGALVVQANKTLSLKGGSLANLSGTTLTGGRYSVGAGGVLQLANNTSIVTLDATIDLAGAGAVVQGFDTGTSTQIGLESSLTSIGAAGTLKVLGGRNYTTANAIGNSGVIQLGGGTFASGTLTGAAGSTLTGFGVVASVVGQAGTTMSSGGPLAFTATGNTFSGAITGTEIDFTGGTDLLKSGTSLAAGAIGVSGGATVTLGASLVFSGKLTQAAGTTLALGSNTLTLGGSGTTLAGTVSGAGGTLAFSGGSQAIENGAALSVGHWSLTGGLTTLDETLTYGGQFTSGAGATLTLGTGDKLTLTGAASLSGTVDGGSRLKLSDATLSGLTIGGTVNLEDAGAIVQTGMVTLGGATKTAATLTIDAGATYTISAGGIALGASSKSSITNNGTLTGAATGTSTVAVQIADAGAIVASTGTLDLAKALTGAGTMSVNGGATLEVDSSAASTLSMTFNGGAGTLALADAAAFAAAINGFAAGDTIDLLGRKATSAALGAGDTLVIMNRSKVIATLQLSGNYAGDTFAVRSDGHGGSAITVAAHPAFDAPGGGGALQPTSHFAEATASQRFVGAMASLGDRVGPASIWLETHSESGRGILSAPGPAHLA